MDMVSKQKGIVSDVTMLENHPLVDNVDDELVRLEEQNVMNPISLNTDAPTTDLAPLPITPAESREYNGAQIASAMQIVGGYKAKTLSEESAVSMLMEFLKIGEEKAKGMLR
jgi:hypothetical protein